MSSEPQFDILKAFGLRPEHRVLDIGCGRLGLGSLLIPYLEPRRYFGVEPFQSLIEDGVRFELGHNTFDQKRPLFLMRDDFAFHKFGVKFPYMIANGLLREISEDMILSCLQGAAASLEHDGVMLASWAVGPRDHSGTGWNPMTVAEYTVGKLVTLASQAGLGMEVLDRYHPDGHCWAAFFPLGSRKLPARERELPPSKDGYSGYVEQIRDMSGYQLVEGWAIDPETRQPAAELLIADGAGKVRAVLGTDWPREDTASVYGVQALRCGFRGLVSDAALGVRSELQFYALTAGGEAYRLLN